MQDARNRELRASIPIKPKTNMKYSTGSKVIGVKSLEVSYLLNLKNRYFT
jgi:hypothetical protein